MLVVIWRAFAAQRQEFEATLLAQELSVAVDDERYLNLSEDAALQVVLDVIKVDGLARREEAERDDAHRSILTAAKVIAPMLEAKGVRVRNHGHAALTLTVRDLAYGQPPRTLEVAAHAESVVPIDLSGSQGWYDLLVTSATEQVRLAGHQENGGESFSDPVAHGAAPLVIASPNPAA